MCESRAVPSGKVYRQLFDAQVQLSRSLLAGRRDPRPDCLSAEDSDTECSSASRCLYPVSSRGQQVDEDADDVSKLPDIVVAAHRNSDIIGRLTEKKRKQHQDAVRDFNSELTQISEMCATLVRGFSQEMLLSLQEVDLRLKSLRSRMEGVNGVSLQGVFSFWEEAEKELRLKKKRVMELHSVLSKFEADRTSKIRDVFRRYCHLLNSISFLPPSDVFRLIHGEASLVNQSLLANRRNVAFLQLRLREENLQQTSLFRLHWDHCLNRWRRNRVGEVVQRFRRLCSSEANQQLLSVQQTIQEMKETQRTLEERRCDIIGRISSLVPPYSSNALVSDWFSQLTTVNHQIESLHADFLHQLRCCCEQRWQERLAEVERSKGELLALQLPEKDTDEAVGTEILPLIGQSQNRDEERLADLDLLCDAVARHSLTLSSCAFAVLRGAVLLWETHLLGLETRKEQLEQQLDQLRASQQQRMQWKRLRLDSLLAGLRQESSEETLEEALGKTASYLEDIKLSCSKCVPDQCQLFDGLPALCMEEFQSYSSKLSSFYHLDGVYTPSRERLRELHPPLAEEPQEPAEPPVQESQDDPPPLAPPTHDWLTEAESSLQELYDSSNRVTFTSSSGVAYAGPAFRNPAHSLPGSLQEEAHLSRFPEGLLVDTLSRTRTLFMEHLEQHLSNMVSSAGTMVSNRKETLQLEEELQLQQLHPKYVQRLICQPRLAELQLHRRRVNIHCADVMDVMDSCKEDMQKMMDSISSRNQGFLAMLADMERDAAAATRSHQLGSLGAALQEHLDQHTKQTQRCETAFRQAVQAKAVEIRRRTTGLLRSFRLFSEGGDFAPQELRLVQRRLTEEAKQLAVKEEAFYSEMEEFESSSLQQVREVCTRLEENICLMRAELEFKEQIQQVYGSTQVQLKAEVVGSSQHQSAINGRLEDLKMMIDNAQACPDQVLSSLWSANDELKRRRGYLELPPRAQKTVVEADSRGRATTGKSPKRLKQRPTKPVRQLRRHVKFIRSDKNFQVFGPELGPEQGADTLSSRVTSVLWKANDKLLMDGEEFYRARKSSVSKLLLLPETLELWAASMQQRLLGYQTEAQTFLSMCRQVLEEQLETWDELLRLFPSVLIGNLERRHEAELRKGVGGVRAKLARTLSESEKERCDVSCRLRISLRNDKLQDLVNREETRQQQLHGTICSAHLQVQDYAQVIGEKFVTSLASIAERLLHQLDASITSTPETKTPSSATPTDSRSVSTETEPGYNSPAASRTWPGIPYFPPPSSIPVDLLPSVATRTTAPITTTKCTMGHLSVVELRDAAVKRFEQLLRTELLQSEDDRHERLKELQRWNTHWRQQIHPLKNMI
ncbi:coiled-coil domain-containing protein 180 [Nelusetta ayraudi]|uniref:coiled-coil domain-containing protein 180 n=1 Tax=Nelusetta ayraudi TaxID=303726 RepID=UPI003F7250D3